MFLFSTPPTARQPVPADPVVAAIRQGAERTGTGFEYLLDTAKRESALDPTAKASTSSATGLFQFIEQTWLSLVKSEGAKVGLAEEARAVTARGDGSLTVGDPATRQAILKLREDPDLSAVMAGALTRQNRDSLAGALGREPKAGELYMAHVLGARGAADLITSAEERPDRAAATDFPEAARANRGIFFERGGRARSASEVYRVLSAHHGGGSAAAASPTASAPAASTPSTAPGPAASAGLTGLFQTGPRGGPVSEAVAKIWRSQRSGAETRTAALSFFPRGEGDVATVLPVASDAAPFAPPAAAPSPGSLGTAPVSAADAAKSAPLPPSRPRDVGGSAAHLPARAPTAGSPLDLTAFSTRARP